MLNLKAVRNLTGILMDFDLHEQLKDKTSEEFVIYITSLFEELKDEVSPNNAKNILLTTLIEMVANLGAAHLKEMGLEHHYFISQVEILHNHLTECVKLRNQSRN